MERRIIFIALLGSSINVFAESGLYASLMFDYNFLAFKQAETASAFSPDKINATAAHIENHAGYGLGFGYRFNPVFRAAITGQVRPKIDFSLTDDGQQTATGYYDNYTVFANGYLSIPQKLFDRFQPYVLGGLGVSHNKTANLYWPLNVQTEFGRSINQLAWQVGIGSLFSISDCIDIDFNYAYVHLGDVKYTGQYDAIGANGVPASGAPTQFRDTYSNQLELGLHYRIA